MSMPILSLRLLLEAGVHFGHHPRRWNPKMSQYLFGIRNAIHIIDLEKTLPMLQTALAAIRDVASKGGRILYVGTKRQASDLVADAAKKCGQYYVNHRWLGGMLTNWKTVSVSIQRLRQLEQKMQDQQQGLTKKELLKLTRLRDKLECALGGIKEMGGVPDLLIVIDTNKEAIAIQEANTLGIPVVGILDSNSNPDGVLYPVPGNDDALRAIELYCNLTSAAILDGMQAQMISAGVDVGESTDLPLDEADMSMTMSGEEPTAPLNA